MKESDIATILEQYRESNWSHVRREHPHDIYIETEDFCGEYIDERHHVINLTEYRKYLQSLIDEIDSFKRNRGDWVIVEEYVNSDQDHIFYDCSLEDFYYRKNYMLREK